MATFIKIATNTVGSGGVASVTFSSIPATYTDLLIKISARSSTNSSANIWDDVGINFNSAGVNTSVTSKTAFGYSASVGSNSNASWSAGFVTNPNATANTFSNTEIYIPNYTSASLPKAFSVNTAANTNATTPINANIDAMLAGLWSPGTQAAITSIGFSIVTGTSPLFVQYSTFTLYGISNA